MISRGLMLAAAAALFVSMSAPAFADCAGQSNDCERVGDHKPNTHVGKPQEEQEAPPA